MHFSIFELFYSGLLKWPSVRREMDLHGVVLRTNGRGMAVLDPGYSYSDFGTVRIPRRIVLIEHPPVVLDSRSGKRNKRPQRELTRYVVHADTERGMAGKARLLWPDHFLVIAVLDEVYTLVGAIQSKGGFRHGDSFDEVPSHALASRLKESMDFVLPHPLESMDRSVRTLAVAWTEAVRITDSFQLPSEERNRTNGFYLDLLYQEPLYFLRKTVSRANLQRLFVALLAHCFHRIHTRAFFSIVCDLLLDTPSKKREGVYLLGWRCGMFTYEPPVIPKVAQVLLPAGRRTQTPELYWDEFQRAHGSAWHEEGVLIEQVVKFDPRVWRQCAHGGRCTRTIDPSEPLATESQWIHVHIFHSDTHPAFFVPSGRLGMCEGDHESIAPNVKLD